MMPDSDKTPEFWRSLANSIRRWKWPAWVEAEVAEYCRSQGIHTSRMALTRSLHAAR